MDLVMEAVERGWMPDPVVRAGIRRLLARKLAEEGRGGPAAIRARREERLAAMRDSAVALHTRDANTQHYELPPAFFQRVLGPRLKYSCALFERPETTLAQAEEAMLALTAARAGLADGLRVLELGCGWGSWSLWMAEHYPRAAITAVSNSAPQRAFIEGRAAALGLTNLEVVTADMNRFDTAARFDRVVSVEMFEHMRNWPELMRRVAGWLAPGGQLFLHVFCHREHPYFYEVDGRSDWMARHFFTGGLMPSEDLIGECAEGWVLEQQWRVHGAHYARTLLAWLARQDANRDALMPLFTQVYGAGAARWFERWRLFFLACAELFAYGGGEEWFVTHARLRPAGTP
jgi:cyclopropane-fatty-acyl-phospholipid synthase